MPDAPFPYQLVDLTHDLHPDIPNWQGGCGFEQHLKLDYADPRQGPVPFRIQKLTLYAGIGTHIDAPAHCIPGGLTIHELTLDQLLVPCCIVDLRPPGALHAPEDATLQIAHIEQFQAQHGPLHPGDGVMVHTGWDHFWENPQAYRNDLRFPSVSLAAAHYLLEKGVRVLGIDTLSPDRPETEFPVHKACLGAGCLLIENATRLGSLPPRGAWILALPIKTREGVEAPIRLIGLKNKGQFLRNQ